MSAVLSPGASQLGLTTTVLPQIRLQTTLPFLHQHAVLQKKLLEQRKFDQLPQYDEMQDSALSRTHKPRRRTKRQHGNERAYLHVKSGGGYNLRIHKNGTIDGEPMSGQATIWCVLQIMVTLAKGFKSPSNDRQQKYNDRKVYIQGWKSKLYVCMNSSGILYARDNLNHTDDCEFYEDTSGHRYYYISAAHGKHSLQKTRPKRRYQKEWFIGLDNDGKPKLGYKTSRSQTYGAFLVLSATRTTSKPSVFGEGTIIKGVETSNRPRHGRHRGHRGHRGYRRCGKILSNRKRRRCRRRHRKHCGKRTRRTTPTPPTTTSTSPPPTTRPTMTSTPVVTTTATLVPTHRSTNSRVKITVAPNTVESRDFTPTDLPTQRPSTPPKFDDIVQSLSHFGEQSHDQHFQRKTELEKLLESLMNPSNGRTKSLSRRWVHSDSKDLLERVLTRQKERKHSSR